MTTQTEQSYVSVDDRRAKRRAGGEADAGVVAGGVGAGG